MLYLLNKFRKPFINNFSFLGQNVTGETAYYLEDDLICIRIRVD